MGFKEIYMAEVQDSYAFLRSEGDNEILDIGRTKDSVLVVTLYFKDQFTLLTSCLLPCV